MKENTPTLIVFTLLIGLVGCTPALRQKAEADLLAAKLGNSNAITETEEGRQQPPPSIGSVVGISASKESVQSQSAAFSVFVSTMGTDAGSGSFANPFRTIERAQEWVRSTDRSRSKLILIRGGTYRLSQPLRFNEMDGGIGEPVTYAAYDNEKVVVSGGVPVTNFTVAGQLFYAHVPGLSSRRLYSDAPIASQPQPVRFPAQGYFRLLSYDLIPGSCTETLNSSKKLVLKSIKIKATGLSSEADIGALNGSELVILKSFSQSRLNIANVIATGPDELTVFPTQTAGMLEGCNFDSQQEAGYRVYFERNWRFFERHSVFGPAPGTFTFANNSLYFYARPFDNALTGGVVVPKLESLIEIEEANNLHFVGLEFKHTKADLPSQTAYIGGQAGLSGFCVNFLQAECTLPSTINIRKAKKISIVGATIAHTGAHGVRIEESRDITLEKNRFQDIAGNAIIVGTFLQDASKASQRISLVNNVITSAGRMYDGVGILAGYVRESLISKNSISDVSYSGISLGWFGQTSMPRSDTSVTFNNIGHVNYLHGDGGGIYLMEGTRGDIIRDNYIHHIQSEEPGYTGNTRHAIYLDNQTTGVLVLNNQVVNVINGLFLQNQLGYQSTYNEVAGLWVSGVNVDVFDFSNTSPTNKIQILHGIQQSIITNSGARLDK